MESNIFNNISIEKFYDPKYLLNKFDKFFNIPNNNKKKDNKYYKSLVLFLIIFICYILYTIKTQIIPGLLFAFVFASFFHLNRKQILKFLKKYNLHKLPIIKNIM